MFAFKKTQRLLHKSDYDHVFEQATKLVNPEFIVLYRKNNLGYARLGLAISKKKIAKAHDRNRMKRILRESFRLNRLPAVDLVILAKPGAAKEKNIDISERLSKTWEKLTSCYAK